MNQETLSWLASRLGPMGRRKFRYRFSEHVSWWCARGDLWRKHGGLFLLQQNRQQVYSNSPAVRPAILPSCLWITEVPTGAQLRGEQKTTNQPTNQIIDTQPSFTEGGSINIGSPVSYITPQSFSQMSPCVCFLLRRHKKKNWEEINSCS